MILIADSGATKTDWALIDEDSGVVKKLQGIGLNPNFLSVDELFRGINEVFYSYNDPIPTEKVSEIYFYGSGISGERAFQMKAILWSVFTSAPTVIAESDLLGAARALLGDEAGFAAILGTGMNTCVYDGKKVVSQIPPLGFILGDEGSGAYIGRVILRDFLRGQMPDALKDKLATLPGMRYEEIISGVYSKPRPSSFCAGLCKEVLRCAQRDGEEWEYICRVVREAFETFFSSIVMKYPDYQGYEFNCVGSAGYIFRDILSEVAVSHGMRVGKIIQAPLDGLIAYHLGT